jgi:hypothetical protein
MQTCYASDGFDVLTAVIIKSNLFGLVTPCSAVENYQHFGRTCCLHLHCRRISEANIYQFDPKNEGSKFFRNVNEFISDYTPSHFRKLYFSCYKNYDIKDGGNLVML